MFRKIMVISVGLLLFTFTGSLLRGEEKIAPLETHARGTLGAVRQTTSSKPIETFAQPLAAQPESADRALRSMLRHEDDLAESVVAEILWMIACKNALEDPLARLAAELLESDDPFAVAYADWAIATKVGIANNRPVSTYPDQRKPDWFRRWTAWFESAKDPGARTLSGTVSLLTCDYARTAIGWDVHRSPKQCCGSAKKFRRRAAEVMHRLRWEGSEKEIQQGQECLHRIDEIIEQMEGSLASFDNEQEAISRLRFFREGWLSVRKAARPLILAHPAIKSEELVFVKRHAGHSLRNITGSQYPWNHKPGGDVVVQHGFSPTSALRELIRDRLGPGHVHGMDLHWSGDRIVFAYARQPNWPPSWDTGPTCSPYVFQLRREQPSTNIYTMDSDGSNLRQVTDHPLWSDFEPTWTPEDDIVFASDRSGRSSECGSFTSDHTVINIYRISPNGTGLLRLSDNKDIDRYPHALDNGLIGYTRWEYQERHFTEVHALWTVHPDGTMADALFNQHMRAPWGLRDTRSIPGSNRLVSIATGHHTLAYGPVVLIDPSHGPNEARGLQVLTPHTVPQEGPPTGRPVPEGGVPEKGGLYQTPFALSEEAFLVSYSYNQPPYRSGAKYYNDTQFAIYYVDVFGNRELLHRDPTLSCAFPMLKHRRPVPPKVASVLENDETIEPILEDTRSMVSLTSDSGYRCREETRLETAVCYVADVYSGLEDIPRGTIRHLRISQRFGWPLDDEIGAMRYIPQNAFRRQYGFWAWAPVRVLGTVPVAEDGSAYFRVPADTAVYFQALDKNLMEIRRMRSHISLQPNEVRGCLGCHETRPVAPHLSLKNLAVLDRDPSRPKPPPWGADRLLDYRTMVQPIFDRHCVACHAPSEEAALDLRGTLAEGGFAQSFRSLFPDPHYGAPRSEAVPLVSISDRFSGAGITRTKEFGSHRSRLILTLLEDELHREKVVLSPDEWETLTTWVDANAPYYADFFNRRPREGDQPIRDIRVRIRDVVTSE